MLAGPNKLAQSSAGKEMQPLFPAVQNVGDSLVVTKRRGMLDKQRMKAKSLETLLCDPNLFARAVSASFRNSSQSNIRDSIDHDHFLGLLAHLGIIASDETKSNLELDGLWKKLAEKYAGVPHETGQLTQRRCSDAFWLAHGRQGGAETKQNDSLHLQGFKDAMREIAREVMQRSKGCRVEDRGEASTSGAIPALQMQKMQSHGAAEEGTISNSGKKLALSHFRGSGNVRGSQTARASDSNNKGHEGERNGAQTERMNRQRIPAAGNSDGPRSKMIDLGGGFFRVCIDGCEPKIVKDDASKLMFARQARLELKYRSRPLKQPADLKVIPPWGVSAFHGHWAEGSFAFDPARIAGRTLGPDGARCDPYQTFIVQPAK